MRSSPRFFFRSLLTPGARSRPWTFRASPTSAPDVPTRPDPWPATSWASPTSEHNRELIGAAGLELTQNKVLTGTDGKGSEEIGRSGVIIPTGEQKDQPARAGATVRTTLNPDLQSIAQETIDRTVAAQHADWGIVMAMEPSTGKVVVLADSNSVDPSDPSATSEENRTARSVQAVFEPGSVGKVVTFATALEEGPSSPRTPGPSPTPGARTADRPSRTPTSTRPSR